jgi:hypothetical protein
MDQVLSVLRERSEEVCPADTWGKRPQAAETARTEVGAILVYSKSSQDPECA